METLTKSAKRISGLGLSRLIFYAASFGILILVYVKFEELAAIRTDITKANFLWLGIALLSEFTTYFFIALNYKYVIKIKGHEISVKELYPATFVIQFLNQVLPSGTISGQIFFIDFLKKRGMSLAESIGRAILELVTMLCAFGILFIASAFLIAGSSIGQEHPELGLFIYIFLGIAVFFLIIFFLLQKQGRGRFVHWIVKKFDGKFGKNGDNNVAAFFDEFRSSLRIGYLSSSGNKFGLAILCQLCVMFLDIFSLFCLARAIGFPITFTVAFVAFTLTQFISMISFVPGGIGVFEGGMTIFLITFGMVKSVAVSLTLLYRGLIFWLPLPIGWMLYRRYQKQKRILEAEGLQSEKYC